MNKYCIDWIQEWCCENGWTDLFVERREYWAFPPHAVMPMPIPADALHTIKLEKGLSVPEKIWFGTAWLATLGSVVLSYSLECPMPLVAAFAFCALIVARTEED